MEQEGSNAELLARIRDLEKTVEGLVEANNRPTPGEAAERASERNRL